MTPEAGQEVWVVNASPIILLGKIAELRLLEALAPRAVVPGAVVQELRAGVNLDPEGGPTLAWAESRNVRDIEVPQSIAGWDLGAGESQVLAHCLAGGACAVLDDAEARAAARVHGVRVVGTLGVILRARRANLIASAAPLIERLRERGAYLADGLVRQALRKLGE